MIDAHEGVRENSRRHGYMMSMLGIRQIAILVNKMDLPDYSQDVFAKIVNEYTAFLKEINVTPACFIPVSGMQGDNIAELSPGICRGIQEKPCSKCWMRLKKSRGL